jgi:polysaccharide biosynthesis/export protein
MNRYTPTVCAALVLTFAVAVAVPTAQTAQTVPSEGGGQSTPAAKPAEKAPPAKPAQQKPSAKPAPDKTVQTKPPTPPATAPTPPAAAATPAAGATTPAAVPGAITPPPGYLIGPDDVLSIVFWKDKDMTSDVQVRPDGKISLSLINEVMAAGLTPDQLREHLTEESKKYLDDANITVVVKQINSRKVYITGQIAKQGPYTLSGPTTVMQLISMAGGVAEFSDSKNIMVLRMENGRQVAHKVNYKELVAGKKLAQNIELKPGDTIVVP